MADFCGVERFREIVEAQKENLKYLRQFEATVGAFQAERYSEFKALLTGLVGEAFKDKIEEVMGDRISFQALIGALQLILIANPGALGTCLEIEVDRLETFFREEKRRLDRILAYINEMLERLLGDWSDLDNLGEFQKNFQRSLNRFYNQSLPSAMRRALLAKTQLIDAQNMVIDGNVFEDDEHFLQKIQDAKIHLSNAKAFLEDPDNPSILERFLRLLALWQTIKQMIEQLTDTRSPAWGDLRNRFEEIGQNYRNFLEAFYIALMTLAESIQTIDTTESDQRLGWKEVHRRLILNPDFDPRYLGMAANVYAAIDAYITHETPQPVVLDLPLVGGVVNSETFAEWEKKANVYRSLKNDWISSYDHVIALLDRITTGPAAGALAAVKTIYSPITNAVIDMYKAIADPIWVRLIAVVASIDNVFYRVAQGKRVSGSLVTQIQNLKTQAQAIVDAVALMIEYFDTNDPKGALQTALGLSLATSAALSSFETFSDTLGLDYLSNLLNSGNFAEVFNLSEENADTVGQLAKCLSELGNVSEAARGYAAEIRKIAAAEIERKRKLKQTTETMILDAVQNQEKMIEERIRLLTNFEAALGGGS